MASSSTNGRRGSAPSKVESPCGECKKEVKKTQKGLQCSLCDRWYHALCQDVNDELYKGLKKDKGKDSPQAHWYCQPTCNALAINIIKTLSKVEMKVERLIATVHEINDKVKMIEDYLTVSKTKQEKAEKEIERMGACLAEVDAKVKQQEEINSKARKIELGDLPHGMIDAIKNIQREALDEKMKEIEETRNTEKITKENTPGLDQTVIETLIKKSSRENIAENEERTRRSKNLLIFGIEEKVNPDRSQRQLDDKDKVDNLLTKLSSTKKAEKIIRLGKYKQDQTSPRPLRLTFASEEERNKVLEKFKAVRRKGEGKENQEINKGIGMRRDMTVAEREAEAALFKQWKEKVQNSKASGDGKIWIRRNGEVKEIKRRTENTEALPHTPPNEN